MRETMLQDNLSSIVDLVKQAKYKETDGKMSTLSEEDFSALDINKYYSGLTLLQICMANLSNVDEKLNSDNTKKLLWALVQKLLQHPMIEVNLSPQPLLHAAIKTKSSVILERVLQLGEKIDLLSRDSNKKYAFDYLEIDNHRSDPDNKAVKLIAKEMVLRCTLFPYEHYCAQKSLSKGVAL